MKPSDIRQMSDEQLDLTLKEQVKNLFHLRFQSATERLETPSEILKVKRDVARIRTVLRERELVDPVLDALSEMPEEERLDLLDEFVFLGAIEDDKKTYEDALETGTAEVVQKFGVGGFMQLRKYLQIDEMAEVEA